MTGAFFYRIFPFASQF